MNYIDQLKLQWFPQNAYERDLGLYNRSRNVFQTDAFCHAPMRNMYIGHRGVITACCYNSIHALGIWPVKSLMEIWKGERAEQLRQSLKAYDLSKGCSYCESQLSAHNFDALKASQFDNNTTNRNNMPSVLEFELDNKCNLACTMCNETYSSVIAARKGLPKYDSPYNESFLEDLKPFIPFLTEAKFYGGEPFLIKIYYEIWDLIIALNPSCRISIQTNATIMNERVKGLLRNPNLVFNISIDSLRKETYESIRDGADFSETMNNLRIFIDYARKNKNFIGISACMMQTNVLEAPDFLRFCNEHQIQLYFHTVFQPESLSLSTMNVKDLEKVLSFLRNEAPSIERISSSLVKKNHNHFMHFISQVEYWASDDYRQKQKRNQMDIPISWEDFFSRVERAAVAVYGPSLGRDKASRFIAHVRELSAELTTEEQAKILSSVHHDDLSSSIHQVIDLNKERLAAMIRN
jgi:MoaA/NifB/PqqE/SkfB family radical SAM enzyme